jgi:hypothetical protein
MGDAADYDVVAGQRPADQFIVMWKNSRCSTLFDFEVRAGPGQEVAAGDRQPGLRRQDGQPAFYLRMRYLFEPAASAVISSRWRPGNRSGR